MWLPTLITLLVTNSIPEETAASLRESLPQARIARQENRITIQGTSDEIIRAKSLFYRLDRPLDQIVFKAGLATPEQLINPEPLAHPKSDIQLSQLMGQDQDLQLLASCRDGRTVVAELGGLHLTFQPRLQANGHNIQLHLKVNDLETDLTLGHGRSLAIQGLSENNAVLLISAEVLNATY